MFRFAARRRAPSDRVQSTPPHDRHRAGRLRRILIAWFCLWLAIILFAWRIVETGGGPDAELSGLPFHRSEARG